jgi:hypothetical protein
MPLIETKGAASAQGFGEFAKVGVANYIEDCFSVWLYTGNGSTQTITNGIDLSGKGGLVWIKNRNTQDFGNTRNHWLFDSARTAGNSLASNTTSAQNTAFAGLIPFSSTGFSINTSDPNLNGTGTNPYDYASWTFRKQPKFFDVVTYTGTSANRTVAHNLGSVPGCIIVKRTDTSADWQVYHRSNANTEYMVLNSTAAKATGTTRWNSTTPTSTEFSLGTDTTVNASGATYVAYLFAHDAGGFGASGSDNVISCGSVVVGGSASNISATLGWEPQYVLWKKATASGPWNIVDSMRGNTANASGGSNVLNANASTAESAETHLQPTATGFKWADGILDINSTYIYIAIRRGPMRTPTTGTSVFTPIARTGTGATATVTGVGFPPDFAQIFGRNGGANWAQMDRLRGINKPLGSNQTAAEDTGTDFLTVWGMDGVTLGPNSRVNQSSGSFINHFFRRAPGFFDVVCYTGTGASATLNHNLGVSPEMVIVKGRTVVSNWETYLSLLGGTSGNGLAINSNGAKSGTPPVSSVTATTFTLNNGVSTTNGQTYVAYLFATVAGVSKVGSYTGTGTTLQVNCGFTGGSRFVLIKRTDSTGDWYVWDSARGIVAGNDPYLLLNSTAAEVTGTDYIDTFSSGFEISSTAPAAINANGGTFIFLAIA